MSQKDKTREELLFELEQVKRADEDHFQSLLDDMGTIQRLNLRAICELCWHVSLTFCKFSQNEERPHRLQHDHPSRHLLLQ